MNLSTERYYWQKRYNFIIGIDEAGRGPLAGPITVAAVLISKKKVTGKINKKLRYKKKPRCKNQIFREILRHTRDSKKLSEKQREKIFELVTKCPAIKFITSSVGPTYIDKFNIEKATKRAIRNCLKKLNLDSKNFSKTIILIDGNKIGDGNLKIKQRAIIKGDEKIFSIALASIIAKVVRDRKMKRLAQKYPQYKFEIHKGYGTKLHLTLLKKFGPSPIHRYSYKPIKTYE